MQDQNQSASEFSERTDRLAAAIGISLRKLGPEVGISPAMLFAYRSGNQSISKKAWAKIRAAEAAHGLLVPAVGEAPGAYGLPAGPTSPELKEYLAFIRACREEAEKMSGGDAKVAIDIMDRLVATWMSRDRERGKRPAGVRSNYEDVLAQVIFEQKAKRDREKAQSSAAAQEGTGKGA